MRERLAWSLILVLAAAWAVGLRVALARKAQPATPVDDEGHSTDTTAWVEHLPPLVPPAGTVGAADAGRLSARDVVALLRAQRTAELARVFEATQVAFERDPHWESSVDALLDAFAWARTADGPTLDAWIAATPEAFQGYAARGAAELGQAVRVGLAASTHRPRIWQSTPTARTLLRRSRKDLESAVRLRPKLVAAYTALLKSFVTESAGVPIEWLDRALDACPSCSGPRVQFILGLRPIAGGSFEAMQAFAEDAQRLAPENPRIRALLGYMDYDGCLRNGALGACDRALDAYPDPEFRRARASALIGMGRHPEAVADATTALEARPFEVEALLERSRAYVRDDRWDEAVPDLRLALQLDPENPRALSLADWVIDRLDRDAAVALQDHDLDQALRSFDRSARLVPELDRFSAARDTIATRLGRGSSRGAAP